MPSERGNNDFFRSKAIVRGDVHMAHQRRPAPQVTPASGADVRAQAAAAPAATPGSRKAYPAPPFTLNRSGWTSLGKSKAKLHLNVAATHSPPFTLKRSGRISLGKSKTKHRG